MGYIGMGYFRESHARTGCAGMDHASMGCAGMGYFRMGHVRTDCAGMGQARVGYTKMGNTKMGHAMMGHARMNHLRMGHSCRVCIRRLGLAGAKKIVYIEHAVDACRVAVYKRCSGLHNTA